MSSAVSCEQAKRKPYCKGEHGMKGMCDIDVPLVSLLGNDIVNKVPGFWSRMYPQGLEAFWLLKVGVGDYKIEFSANRNEAQNVGVHVSSAMMTLHIDVLY